MKKINLFIFLSIGMFWSSNDTNDLTVLDVLKEVIVTKRFSGNNQMNVPNQILTLGFGESSVEYLVLVK